MSEEEQIIKDLTDLQPMKEKDPKKVAAGMKLAEYDKKAKAALESE